MKNAQIYQLHILLDGSKPGIWRRILVESDNTLEDLHYILQDTMGWENCHLHQFKKGNTFFQPDDDDWGDAVNYNKERTTLKEMLPKVKSKITYEYDFGDSWGHTIVLEKKLEPDPDQVYPVCVTGRMACPPEDCGGIWGYMDLVQILSDPKHESYEEYSEYYPDLDAKYFDKDEVNARLS